MKLKNIILTCIITGSLFSCYEDLGNYKYHDINEITVSGIDEKYARDVDDSLNIYPSIEGTQFSDTSRFSYQWEIDRRIKAETFNLNIVIDILPGNKDARFIVTDKETGLKKYHRFAVTISSSTAGDLIMVLSKYKGKAELSYLRLDKPSNFAVNYYQDRFNKELGINPQQLHIRLCQASAGGAFSNSYGKIMVLADNEIKLIDKRTLMPDTIYNVLKGENYIGNASYPKPDIEGYKSEFIAEEGISIWRDGAYGLQLTTYFNEVSNGTLYFATHANAVWTTSYAYKKFSPYNEGPLSPYAFYDAMNPTPHGNLRQAGFECGNLMVFDYKVGRFAYASYGVSREIPLDQMKAYLNYNLVYGSATVMSDNTFFSVLQNGDTFKLLLTTRKKDATIEEGDENNVFKVAAELTVTDSKIINASTRFYVTHKANDMFFVTGDKLYKYNLLDIKSQAPNESNVVAKLSDYGYDSKATITSLFVSRSEMSILLGVSRYGDDVEAMSEEIKGDILGFDLNNSNFSITHNPAKTHKGIAGIPVDVKVKYATHNRFGLNFSDVLVDNI